MDYAAILREPLIEVKCGVLQGILHMDCFYCPGIHCPCIEYRGQMISPKNFTILGEKQNLKDWKKAVRIHKSSMRDLMERGFLDFFNHDQTCTGKCMSRTPNKNAMEMINSDISTFVNTSVRDLKYFSMSPAAKPTRSIATGSPIPSSGPVITEVVGGQARINSLLSENEAILENGAKSVTPNRLFKNNQPKSVVMDNSANASPVRIKQEPVSPEPDPTTELSDPTREQGLPTPPVISGFDELVQLADRQTSNKPITDSISDSVKFWEGIFTLGLMDEFIKEIKLSLDLIRSRVIQQSGDLEQDAMKLSNVVNDLGLFKVLQEKMKGFQRQTQLQQHKLNMEISILEKKWSQTQKWKTSLEKTQRLIEQVNVSSRLKRSAAALSNGIKTEENENLSLRTKSPRLDETGSLASKAFVITMNNDSMETEDFNEPSTRESPVSTAKNEDFLVTITSRHQIPAAVSVADEDDIIFGERQKELDGDLEDRYASQLDLAPRRSCRTRTPSAKRLAYSESEKLLDSDESRQVISPEAGVVISQETMTTAEQVSRVEKTQTPKDITDADSEKLLDNNKSGQEKSPEVGMDICDETMTTVEQVSKLEETKTSKAMVDTEQDKIKSLETASNLKKNSTAEKDEPLRIPLDTNNSDNKDSADVNNKTLNSS